MIKKKQKQKLSLNPLTPDEALKALLATPAPHKKRKKPKKKLDHNSKTT